MSIQLAQYQDVVGKDVIDELYVVASHIRQRRLQNINSTPVGGGVAEILSRMIPLLRQLGVDATWDVIKGDQAFFGVTKAFHNALHGKPEEFTAEMKEIFRSNTEDNLREIPITGDYIWIHDPQPVGLILKQPEIGRYWVWRCHIDISTPQRDVWEFLNPYIERYHASIFSMPDFAKPLGIPQYMVAPSIDPLSDKNRELSTEEIERIYAKYHLDLSRTTLIQVSRFDRLKDPLGVIHAYRLIKKRQDCQLILAGGGATDDPEGEMVWREVQEAAEGDRDIHLLLLPPFSDLDINGLVRGAAIVFQKSIKEGFGLTVSEALWKKKPVIGGAVGGIRLQVIDGLTGFLVHSPEGAAQRALQLLEDPELRWKMGEYGYQHVKQNFLITRHVKDYLLLMVALESPRQDVIQLN